MSPRTLFSATILVATHFASAPSAPASADSVVVFNELHYHPADEIDGTEWIELHSLMGVDVDVSNWRLQGGVEFTFPEGTVIPGHGFLLVAGDPENPALAGLGAMGPFGGQLANGGEQLELANNSGRVMDRLSYGDDNGWPVGADGGGPTLAKRDEGSADARPGNWVASPALGGTPSATNFPSADQPPTTTQLVELGADWKYRDADSAPPAGWNSPTFDDSTWLAGAAALYAGDTESNGAGEGLLGYWPLDETTGTSAPNAVAGAAAVSLRNGVSWLTDPGRGQVLAFDGTDDFAVAGQVPQPTVDSDFTWSFWANDQGGANNNVIIGNRYSPGGADFSPREFIKFTTNQFEWHQDGSGAGNIDYAAIVENTWIHHAVVKAGTDLTYYRNGVVGGTSSIVAGINNPQPFYFGGDQANENWEGRLDDPAIWERALPASSIAGLADGSLDPTTAPTVGSGGGGGLKTELALGSTAFYFRKTVAYGGNPERTSLTLQLLADDGAVVTLNGTEIYRQNMPEGPVTHMTLASTEVGDATLGAGVTVPATSLVQGNNVLAVEVHQSAPDSGDLLFAATLSATEQPPAPSDLSETLVFNEIAAADEPDFQIELTNAGSTEVELGGYIVRSSAGPSYTIPAGSLGEGSQLVLDAATLGFTPSSDDRLFLLRPGGSGFADARRVTNRLRGRSPDGRWLYPTSPSFGAPNIFVLNSDVVINEIMYNPRPLRPLPQEAPSVLGWETTWRYNESGADLGDTWETGAHAVGGGWQTGAAPIGFETDPLPVSINTTISSPAGNSPPVLTYYFETDFAVTAEELSSFESVKLSHLIDDGAVFYLNGIEFERYKMAGEPTTASTLANGGGESAIISGVDVPVSLFVVGNNRLSVEVHQSSAGSSDVVFAVKLDAGEEFVPFQKSDDQWIELYNQGDSSVDLGGWEFSDGIGFSFPTGTALGAGEFLVLARDASAFSAQYPGVTVLGDWDGSLSRSGERLILRDANKNIADEVRYYDDGSWPASADGGGATLELIDPAADNSVSSSWRASDEGARSEWQTYSYRASGANHGSDPDLYHEFIFGLLDNGEFLIDDISVVEDPDGNARQLIQNGDFIGSSTASWRFLGTHRHAEAEDGVLHMTTTGSAEHQHNHAETTLKSGNNFVAIDAGLDYEISFRAKWLSGSNQFHSRLYFNRAARTTFLQTPDGGGTPGATNSRAVPNAGPALSGLLHSPAVPAAGEPATVTVKADDPDGVAALALYYEVDGGGFTTTQMAELGDGVWSGSIPGQSASSKIQFYVEATDAAGGTAQFPAGGPDSRAVIPVEDGQAELDYGDCRPNNLRIVMTNADRDFLHTVTNVMSNDRLGCTVIWNESEIYYGCGVRLKGSQRGRAKDVRVGFNLRFPADRLFLGAHETIAIDRSGSGDQFSQKEILVKHAINHAGGGIPGMEDDLIRVIAPQTRHTSSAMLLKSRYDSEFLDNAYTDGGDGTAWEYELIYYPTTTTGGPASGAPEDLKLPNPDSIAGAGVGSLGSDPELYRWHWLIKNNRDADNYTPLVEMLQAYGQSASASYLEDMDRLLDVDQFLRSFAVQVLFGIGDNYSSGSGHNAIFYQRPEDGKFLYFPWDMDFAFSRSETSDLTPNGDLDKLLTSPANERAYYGHLQDIIATTFNRGYMAPWAAHYSCFLPAENLSGFVSYIGARASDATAKIGEAIPETPFEVTTGDTSTSGPSFTVQGDGWIDVREIRLAGSPASLPVTWTDTNSFRVEIPVAPGANRYTIEAYNFQGNLIGTDTVTITGTGNLVPAAAGSLVISEIMYHPATGEAGEDPDDYEFIELLNIDPVHTLDLAGVAFTEGIGFTFPPTQLAPGGRTVVARKLAAFTSRYGGGIPVAGQYVAADGSNKLANGGERIVLADALGNTIAGFTYADRAPWPSSTDGDGYSLERINPGSPDTDTSLPFNWRSSRAVGGSPGTAGSDHLSDWAAANGITDLALDPDRDGLVHLAEFALGTNPFVPDHPVIQPTWENGDLTMQVVVRNGADGIRFQGGQGSDLGIWDAATYLGRVNNGDGRTSTLLFGTSDLAEAAGAFLRFEVTESP